MYSQQSWIQGDSLLNEVLTVSGNHNTLPNRVENINLKGTCFIRQRWTVHPDRWWGLQLLLSRPCNEKHFLAGQVVLATHNLFDIQTCVEVWSDPLTPLPLFFCCSCTLNFSIVLCILGHATQLIDSTCHQFHVTEVAYKSQAQLVKLITPLSCTHALSVTCRKFFIVNFFFILTNWHEVDTRQHGDDNKRLTTMIIGGRSTTDVVTFIIQFIYCKISS